MIIMGIDPGTAIVGYGVIEKKGQKIRALDYGCIRTEAGLPLAVRLKKIYEGMKMLIEKWQPEQIAVEELFFNRNVTTALAVGHARGVILLAAEHAQLILGEYTPLQIKQSLVGNGRAEKKQVQYMVKAFLKLKETPKPDDAADALAVAVCHCHMWNPRLKN